MSRWTCLTIVLVVCWTLCPAATNADEKTAQQPANVPEMADRMLKVEKELGELRSHLEKLLKELDVLKANLRDFPPATLRDLQALSDDFDRRLNALSNRIATGSTETKTEKRELGAGQIQLVNSWNRTVGVTLDGVDYLLRPGQTRTITRAPGPFTYEVHDVQGPRTRTLASDGRPMVIEIFGR